MVCFALVHSEDFYKKIKILRPRRRILLEIRLLPMSDFC